MAVPVPRLLKAKPNIRVAHDMQSTHAIFVVMSLVCLLHMYILFCACLTNVCHELNVFESYYGKDRFAMLSLEMLSHCVCRLYDGLLS